MYKTFSFVGDIKVKLACFFLGKVFFRIKYWNTFDTLASDKNLSILWAGNTKGGGSITVPLTSCMTGLESAV